MYHIFKMFQLKFIERILSETIINPVYQTKQRKVIGHLVRLEKSEIVFHCLEGFDNE